MMNSTTKNAAHRVKLQIDTQAPSDEAKRAALESTNWRANAHANTVAPSKPTEEVRVAKRTAARDQSMDSGCSDESGGGVPTVACVIPMGNASWSRVSSAPHWQAQHAAASPVDETCGDLIYNAVGRAYDSRRHAADLADCEDAKNVNKGHDPAPWSAPARKTHFSVFELMALDTAVDGDESKGKTEAAATASKACPEDYECWREVAAIRNATRNVRVRTLDGAVCEVVDKADQPRMIGGARRFSGPCVVYEVLPRMIEKLEDEKMKQQAAKLVESPKGGGASGGTPTTNSNNAHYHYHTDGGRSIYDDIMGVTESVGSPGKLRMYAPTAAGRPVVDEAIVALNDPAIVAARKSIAASPPSPEDHARFQRMLDKLKAGAQDGFFAALEEYRDAETGAPRPSGLDPVDGRFVRFLDWLMKKYNDYFTQGCIDDMLRLLATVDGALTEKVAAVERGSRAARAARFATVQGGGGGGTPGGGHHARQQRSDGSSSSSAATPFNPRAREFLSVHESPRKTLLRPGLGGVFGESSVGGSAAFGAAMATAAGGGGGGASTNNAAPDLAWMWMQHATAAAAAAAAAAAHNGGGAETAAMVAGAAGRVGAAPPGLAMPSGMNAPPRLTTPPGLTMPPGLNAPPGLSMPHGMNCPPGLALPPGLTLSPGLTMPPGLNVLPGLNAPPGLNCPSGLGISAPPGFNAPLGTNNHGSNNSHNNNGMLPALALPSGFGAPNGLGIMGHGLARPTPAECLQFGGSMASWPLGFAHQQQQQQQQPLPPSMGPLGGAAMHHHAHLQLQHPPQPHPALHPLHPNQHGMYASPPAAGGLHPHQAYQGAPALLPSPNLVASAATSAATFSLPSTGTTTPASSLARPLPIKMQPLKPHGFGDTNGQMGYEAWIEHRKANDPEYALKCKMRQQKRYLRQQFGGGGGMYMGGGGGGGMMAGMPGRGQW